MMKDTQVDAISTDRIAELGRRVLEGGTLGREEALWLFQREEKSEIWELINWSRRVRERFRGDRIKLCSIVNIKAGGCSENCRFCAQSAHYQTASPRHDLTEDAQVQRAAEEAARNGVGALGLVAAWRGLTEGPALDTICRQLEMLASEKKVRPDASLGSIPSQGIADALRAAGLEVYNHNLETSERFFPQVCTTHTYAERLQTLRFLRKAGVRLCVGGIFGMGETLEDRCELALALRELEVENVPLNILNPIAGTPLENQCPPAPLEFYKCLACFRLILPRANIFVAGGRAVNLRNTQGLIFQAGASGLMVGNYLTTIGPEVQEDLRMIRDLGLEVGGKH